jgi:hypothetical protein
MAGRSGLAASLPNQSYQGVPQAIRQAYSDRYFLFRGVPLYDGSGNLVKWYGTNTDIEALRTSENLARGQLEALTNALTALSKESEPEKFLEHILRAIGWRLGAHSLAVLEMNEKIDGVELVAVFEEDRLHLATQEEIQVGREIGTALWNHPVWTEFFRSGEQCVFGEIQSEITTTSGDHFEVLQERNVHYNSRFRPDRVVVFTPDGQFHILDADQIASATVL